MTEFLREVYYETFYTFIEKRNGTVEKNILKSSLDIFLDYTEERKIDPFTLSLEEAENFLLWYQTEEQNREVYDRLTRVLTDFYTLLVLIDHAKSNPFQKMRDIKMKRLFKTVK